MGLVIRAKIGALGPSPTNSPPLHTSERAESTYTTTTQGHKLFHRPEQSQREELSMEQYSP
jgi:hypothetical protein